MEIRSTITISIHVRRGRTFSPFTIEGWVAGSSMTTATSLSRFPSWDRSFKFADPQIKRRSTVNLTDPGPESTINNHELLLAYARYLFHCTLV